MYTRSFYNRNLKFAARALRNNMTPAEEKLWVEFLRSFKPKTHRQRPMGNFIVDFYIPKAKLIIEIDGDVHFGDKSAAKDAERTLYFNDYGLKVIRFTNNEIFNSFEWVCSSIDQTVRSRII